MTGTNTSILIMLFIAFIILFTVVVITGRSLYDLNNSASTTDPRVQGAQSWLKWGVGLASAGTAIVLISLIIMFATRNRGKTVVV